MPVYQVCECTRSTPATAATMDSSADNVARAGLAEASAGCTPCTVAVSRGAPVQCTSTAHRWRSRGTSSVTCTPAPP